MDYVLIGADKRFEYLLRLLQKDKHRAVRCESIPEALRLWEPGITYILPFSATAREQRMLMEGMGKGDGVIGGKLWQENRLLVREKGIMYRDLASEEAFSQKNALPTAEGCLERIIALTPFVLNGTPVLVIGFGKIGSQTARLLRRCGAFVTLCGREGGSLEQAKKQNFPVCTPESLPQSCPWRVIINTVPKKQILSEHFLKQCPNLYLVLDLASGRGNVDTAYLAFQNILFESAGGLPGKIAPETAAFYFYQAIT